MSLDDMPPTRPRSALPWFVSAGAALVALGLIWAAAWFAAAHAVGSGLDAWLAAEAADGRQWTCPERSVDGFPFAFSLHCSRATFRGEVAGHPATGDVVRLSAGIGLAHPGLLVLTLGGPLNLRADDDAFISALNWEDDLRLTLPGIWRAPSGGSIAATRLALSVSAPGQADVNLRAALFLGDAQIVPGTTADMRFDLTAKGVSLPTVDIPGLDGPCDAEGRGVLVGALRLRAPTVARLEAWRQAGGALQLDNLALTQGSFSGTARGTLALDDSHRPTGRLDTVMTGFEPIARSFRIPIEGVQIGGLLSNLMSGGRAVPAPKGALQLPFIFADGGLSIGPFPTGARIAPLY